MATTIPVGEKVKALRLAANMTQLDLATEAGTTTTLVSATETGNREPQLATLRKLAAALNVSVGQLIDGTDVEV